jgi:hypothetical protein
MSAATPLRIGQVNSAGATDALFLEVFGGEVLTAYEENNVFEALQMVRNIDHGKSASFPATWKVNSSYHTPGAEIVGQTSNVNERVITIDDLLIADVFIPVIDEAKNHYDYRSIYSTEAGRALAKTFDQNSAQVIALAARASATVTGGNGGSQLTNAGYATTGSTIAAGIFAAAQALDEKDVPENDRYAVLRPPQYYLMAQTTNVINRDWGAAGVYAEGSVLKVAGISIVKSNNVPSTNVASGPSAYQGDFSNTQGLVFQKAAMGTVKLMDLAAEMEYDMRRQGTLIVSKYALGHGILRPECAVELISA